MRPTDKMIALLLLVLTFSACVTSNPEIKITTTPSSLTFTPALQVISPTSPITSGHSLTPRSIIPSPLNTITTSPSYETTITPINPTLSKSNITKTITVTKDTINPIVLFKTNRVCDWYIWDVNNRLVNPLSKSFCIRQFIAWGKNATSILIENDDDQSVLQLDLQGKLIKQIITIEQIPTNIRDSAIKWLSISQDGKWLLFAKYWGKVTDFYTGRPENSELYSISWDAKLGPYKITERGKSGFGTLVSDISVRNMIAYSEQDERGVEQVVICDLKGENRRIITANSDSNLKPWVIKWSPAGDRLAISYFGVEGVKGPIQIFNFNEQAPVTLLEGTLVNGWQSNNVLMTDHVYWIDITNSQVIAFYDHYRPSLGPIYFDEFNLSGYWDEDFNFRVYDATSRNEFNYETEKQILDKNLFPRIANVFLAVRK